MIVRIDVKTAADPYSKACVYWIFRERRSRAAAVTFLDPLVVAPIISDRKEIV